MKENNTYNIPRGSLTSSKKKDDRDKLIAVFNQEVGKPLDGNNNNEVLENKNKEFQNLSKEDQHQIKREIEKTIRHRYFHPLSKEKKKMTPYILILLISLFFLLLILFTL